MALRAEFTSVPDPSGFVIFASGNGSGRHSPRNRYVAEYLRTRAGVSTLLLDLVAQGETTGLGTRPVALDVELLAERLVQATEWATAAFGCKSLPVGYLGASTGSAAALIASTRCAQVRAVVSRGGRPDLAGHALDKVTAATLLIAGGEDNSLLELNRAALSRLGGSCQLLTVPGTSYLFEEPRALDEVATNATAWFSRHLSPPPERSNGVIPFGRVGT